MVLFTSRSRASKFFIFCGVEVGNTHHQTLRYLILVSFFLIRVINIIWHVPAISYLVSAHIDVKIREAQLGFRVNCNAQYRTARHPPSAWTVGTARWTGCVLHNNDLLFQLVDGHQFIIFLSGRTE